MEPTEHFEHDPDDPLPQEGADLWYHLNRYIENCLRFWRNIGFIR